MRWVHALGAAVAATTLVGSVAQATLSVSLVPVGVNPTAATAIGAGQTVRTFQLKVSQTAGEKWNVGSLQVTLASGGNLSGYFYASPNHDNTQARNSNFNNAYAATDPNFYDTFVSTPQFDVSPTGATQASDLNVVGSSDFPNTGTASNTAVVNTTSGNSTSGNQTLNIVWGDQNGNAAATDTTGATSYTVAQFTVVGNTGAFIRGYSAGTAGNTPIFFPNNGTGPLASASQGTMYLPIEGDVDLNGLVDQLDLNIISDNFVTAGGYAQGDLNGDGIIDQLDLNQVSDSFVNGIGMPPAPALGSVVPEPAVLSLLSLCAAGMLGRRSRR
jgi:hypothetical protein